METLTNHDIYLTNAQKRMADDRPVSPYGMASSDAYRRRAAATTWTDNARIKVDELLTWADLDYGTRLQLTQAANALELASYCLRGVGPERPIKIGF